VRFSLDQNFQPVTALDLPWTSPLLGIRFDLFEDGLEVFYPSGDRFKDPEEVFEERNQAYLEREQLRAERDRALAKLRE
jgi:hypothetical protein